MPQPQHTTQNPDLADILKQLVMPALENLPPGPAGEDSMVEMVEAGPQTGEIPCVRGNLHGQRLIHITAVPLDGIRTTLRINLLAGHFIANPPTSALIVGNLLEPGPFHTRNDYSLGQLGRLSIGCDLVARDDDRPLVERRISELLDVAESLDWFFPLRMPHRLTWQDIVGLEIEWDELPHNNLGGFLDHGLRVPAEERTPLALIRIAQGLERWQDVLRLLKEHPEEFPARQWAALKCLACRQLHRWMPAIRAAREGGIRDGHYPGSPRLSPSYLHALIEGGDDIEALRILGKPKDGEPGFYDWLRGLAYHRAGDSKQAARSFARYHEAWPGDILGFAMTGELNPALE